MNVFGPTAGLEVIQANSIVDDGNFNFPFISMLPEHALHELRNPPHVSNPSVPSESRLFIS